MMLRMLTLADYRVFSGVHDFELSPRNIEEGKRPIVLFGGLNGSGKTSILTAIRHVLYGKQILGTGVTKKSYQEFLLSSIHRPINSDLQSNNARIELSFSYATFGVVKNYLVIRSWERKKEKLAEHITISEDGNELTELNNDQCQGFLNELIPVGVSELFFFDGEKISELAEDSSGFALGDSIKKLLGLDLIDTLGMDLTLIQRKRSKENASKAIQKEIIKLEKQLDVVEKKADQELFEYEQVRPLEVEAQTNINKLENLLAAKGGAWADDRENSIVRLTKLDIEKELLEIQIREIISDKFPIAIAGDFSKQTLSQLFSEKKDKIKSTTSELVQDHLLSIHANLKKLLSRSDFNNANKVITKEFKSLLSIGSSCNILHDISDSNLTRIEASIENAIGKQKTKLKKLSGQLSNIRVELDNVRKNIDRAPVTDQLQPILDEINIENKRKQISIRSQAGFIEKYKRSLRNAIDIVRRLDKLSEELVFESDKDRTFYLSSEAKSLLKEFGKKIATKKIQELENELLKSFEKLSRKDDIKLNIKINPTTFSVRLTGDEAGGIGRNDLSAGEKQIYAISVLEALAKTSGRNLPIIIDTPLGRLDSNHREKLIKNYFPTASHQVIVLSTDTEVDESFYLELSPFISHAYKLEYSSNTGSSSATEGYFWNQTEMEEN